MASAWPRSNKARHFCMLSMSAAPDATPEHIQLSRKLVQEGPTELLGEEFDNTLTATSGLEDFHNFEGVSRAGAPFVRAWKLICGPDLCSKLGEDHRSETKVRSKQPAQWLAIGASVD